MKASTIITDVRREIVETVAAFWSDAELLRHLNRGQMDFVNRTRVLEDTAFMDTQAGRGDYPLPANFLSTKLVLHNTPNQDGSANWKQVFPSTLEKFAQERPNFLSVDSGSLGKPSRFMLWGNTLRISPAPDAANTSGSNLFLWYKSKPINITDTNSDVEIDETLCEALNEYMLWKCFLKEKEKDLAEFHMNNYLAYVKEGRRWIKKRTGNMKNRFDLESAFGLTMTDVSGFNPLS